MRDFDHYKDFGLLSTMHSRPLTFFLKSGFKFTYLQTLLPIFSSPPPHKKTRSKTIIVYIERTGITSSGRNSKQKTHSKLLLFQSIIYSKQYTCAKAWPYLTSHYIHSVCIKTKLLTSHALCVCYFLSMNG